MNRKMSRFIAVLILLALALSGCNGGSGDGNEIENSTNTGKNNIGNAAGSENSRNTNNSADTSRITDGGYYLYGDMSEMCVFFFPDNTADFYWDGWNGDRQEWEYTIDGDVIILTKSGRRFTFTIIDEFRLIDEDGDLWTVQGVYPDAEPGIGGYDWKITGVFHLFGNPSQGAIRIETNGSFRLFFEGDIYEGEWNIEENFLSLETDSGQIFSMLISDNDTLYYGSQDEYYREGTYTPPESAWVFDPYAALNSMVILDSMAMGVNFPASQLYIERQTDEEVVFRTVDDSAYIIFQESDSYKPAGDRGQIASSVLIEQRDIYLKGMLEDLPGNAFVIDKGLMEGVAARAFFKLRYDRESETRFMYVLTGGWRSRRDNSTVCLFALIDCPGALADEYSILLERMWSAMTDE
jgi:predicted small secreted protein